MSTADPPRRVHVTFTFDFSGDTNELGSSLQQPVLDALKDLGVVSINGVEVLEELPGSTPLNHVDPQDVDIPMSCDEIFELEVDEL